MFFKPGASAAAPTATSASSVLSSAASASRVSPSSAVKQGVFFKVNSLGFEQKVSDAVTVVPVAQGRVAEPSKQLPSGATSESHAKPAEHSHMSYIVTPPIVNVPPPKSSVNLFGDDDVSEDDLFSHTTTSNSNAAAHPLGIVGRVHSIERPVSERKPVTSSLFGDAEDPLQPPAVRRPHSNVFGEDGFAEEN